MPIYSIQAPNGKTYQIEGPAGASQEQVIAEVLRQNPDAGQVSSAESGFVPALKAGVSGLKSAGAALLGRTGVMDAERAKEVMAEEEAYQQRTFKPTETWSEAPVRKATELLGGSLPYMAAPLAAGVAGAAAPVAGAGLGAAGLASLAQFTGTNLERQVQEGKALEKTNLGAAAAAAVPQAALDMLSFKLAPGIRGIFAAAGKEVPEQVAAQIAKQGTANMLKDYGAATVKAMGAEGLTEAGQQFFERMQAGLNLTDAKARDEYWDSLVGGAVLGGTIAPAGRYVERGRIADAQAAEEAKKQREERRIADAAEVARKQSPEYAFDVEQKYLALEKQRNDLKAQRIKIDEDSPTVAADRAFNKDLDKQIEELGRNEIAPLAKEYNTVKPLLDAARKKAELEKVTPEDAMLSYLGIQAPAAPTAPAAPRPLRIDDFGQVTDEPVAAEQDPVQAYAQEQVTAARESGQLDMASMADYLMQDPQKAAQVVAERPVIEGFDRKQLAALYGGVGLRLKEREKEAAQLSKEELAQREADIKAMQSQGPTVDQLDMFKSSTEQVEEQRATAETNFDYLDPIFEKAMAGKPAAVAVPADVVANDKAPAMRERIGKLIETADQAEKDYRQARAIKERAAASEAFSRRSEAIKQLDALGKEGGAYAQNLIAARRAQDAALAQLEDTTDRLRTSDVLGQEETAGGTRESLTRRAENARAQFITAALQEAALNRRAAGKQALTQDEAIKAASKLYDTVNDWVERSKTQAKPAKFEEQIVEPAQMRANKIVRPAVTKRVEVEPAVQGITPAERKHFRARIDAVRNQLSEVPETATRETPLLKTQFATSEAKKVAEARGETAETLAGELRRRTEYVRDKMSRMKGMRPMAADALNKAADVMDAGKASRDVLDKTEALVDAINSGLQVRQVDIQALNDALAAAAPTAVEQREAGQQAMFPALDKELGHIRATAKNFQNSPAVRKARMALDLAKQFAVKEAARKEAAAKAETAKREKRINELEEQIDEAKGDYAAAFGEALYEARREARQARDAVLDPLIAKTQKEIDEAQKGLEVALKENATMTERLNYLTSLKQGARSNARAKMTTYQLLRVEEQKSLVEDFQKQLEEAQKTLDTAIAERLSELDSADFAVEAVLDGNVKLERKHWLKLEKRLAELNKVETPASVAERAVAQQELRAQEAAVLAAEKKRIEEREMAKRQRDALEARLQKGEGVFVTRDDKGVITKVEKKGLTGMRVIEGRKEPLATDEEKYNERLREQAMQQLIDQEELTQRREIRDKQRESLEAELEELYKELATYAGPTDVTEINAAIANMKTTREERANLKEKLEVWKEIQSVEAQVDALAEGKPRRKQRPATVETTAKQSANKGFMTGSEEARLQRQFEERTREEQREANRAAQEARGKKAAPEPAPSTRVQGRMLDENIGLFDDYDLDSMGDLLAGPVTGQTLHYKGQGRLGMYGQNPEMSTVLKGIEEWANKNVATTDAQRIANGLQRYIAKQKGEVELFEGDAEFKDLADAARARLAIAEKIDPKDLTFEGPRLKQVFTERKAATPAPRKEGAIAPSTRPVKRERQTIAEFTAPEVMRGLQTTVDETAPFHGMTFLEAARYGAKRTTSPQVRELFNKLAEVFENAPAEQGRGRVYAVNDPVYGKHGGIYSTGWDVIYTLSPNSGRKNTNKILLHELAHAATVRAMNLDPDLMNRMEGLRQRTEEWLTTKEGKAYFRANGLALARKPSEIYALKNAKEFVAELYANREFQKLLTQIPSDKPRKSILTRFVQAMAKYFNFPAEAMQSLFAEAVSLSEEIFNKMNAEIYSNPSLEFKNIDIDHPAPLYANEEMANVGALVDKFVAKNKSRTEKLRAAAGGWLGLETQLVDRFAGFERLSKTMDALKGSQMMYYLRMYDQRMNFVSQAVGNGALKIVDKKRADGKTEHVIESTPGASIKGVVDILKDAKPYVGNGEAVNRLFTMYMSGIRAANKGFQSLNFGADVSERDLKAAMDAVNGNKELKTIFDDARREYNEYNRDMIDFVASTGAISEQTRKELTQENDYIPWYRESNGVAELMIGGASPIRIGSIAEQPYLHELVGGDRPILDFMTSSVQNTNMLADMGLRNLATKNAVFELVDMDMAKIVGAQTGSNIVKFKVDGQDKYASVETDSAGIPGDLLVKGMEGIPTQMPAIFRIMSLPSRLLRKGVTLSPLYAAKQLFRDSLAAPILTGANFSPVAGALRQINKPTKEILERRGIVGGQIFTGTSEDLSKVLRDITDGKSGWLNALAKAEAIGMEADALTRRAQYQSYLDQGLSEMEATLMALESMNFNKRGADPSIHIIGAMIPFFNAQIQGLNVLYKAMTGRMPFNERLKIQEKMLKRGGMLAAGTLAYAAMMQDDEAYKNATPEQKYGNWFVRIPGVAEPVRIPVPFEVGYIFKALPEALYNSMVDEHGGEEAVKAFKQILLQTIPGGTSYGIPQALKPAIEAGLGKSFYTGRDILSAHEKSLLPEEQFRVNTSEAAKLIGKGLGVSPILLEQLVQGYTGPMGLAMLQAVSLGIPRGNTPEQATKRLSELPLVGGAFQPNDAGGIINATYDRFEDAIKVQRTVDKLFEEGRQAEAKELLQKTGNEYAAGEVGDFFATQMKELTQYERAIQAMAITPAEKRQRLDEIKKMKIALAASARQTVEKIAPR